MNSTQSAHVASTETQQRCGVTDVVRSVLNGRQSAEPGLWGSGREWSHCEEEQKLGVFWCKNELLILHRGIFLIYLIISFIVSKCSKNAFRNQTLMLGTTKHPLHPKHPIAVEPRWSKHTGTTSLKAEVGYSQNRFEKTDVFKRQTRSKTPAVYHYGQVQVPLTPSWSLRHLWSGRNIPEFAYFIICLIKVNLQPRALTHWVSKIPF